MWEIHMARKKTVNLILNFHPHNIHIFCSYLMKNIEGKLRVRLFSGIIVVCLANRRAHTQCRQVLHKVTFVLWRRNLKICMLPHTDYFTENLEESPQQKYRFIFQDVYFYGYINFSIREVLNIINHKNFPKTYLHIYCVVWNWIFLS